MNKEFNRMLKLAGLMTEGLYTSDAKAPMEGMSSEKVTKAKLKEKIKDMMKQEGYMGTPYGSSEEMALDMVKTGAGMPGSMREETPGEMAYTEMGSVDEASYEGMERMDGLAPRSAIAAFIGSAESIILALKREGFEDDDIHSYLIELITELPTSSEAMSEAKKDEEGSDTEDVIVAEPGDGEVPAEDVAVDVADTNTQVDVNMDGVPDVDTGSAESKKAFTSLVDTYNSAKELGDPKLTQMIANALTYYNKNIILKSGQPQA